MIVDVTMDRNKLFREFQNAVSEYGTKFGGRLAEIRNYIIAR